MRTALLAGFLTTVWSVHGAAIYERPKNRPPPIEFDYIVVGGGNAGSVVAARLSERFSVLVLEAGPSYANSVKNVPEIEVPLVGPALLKKPAIDWHYETEPMAGLGGRKIPYARGSILGGTSATNFMIFNRGPSDDFDNYAKHGDADEWSWKNIHNNFVPKVERFTRPSDLLNTGIYNASVHSDSGMVGIRYPVHQWPIDDKMLALSQEFPEEFPRNDDVNSGKPLGIGLIHASVGEDGRRSSSAKSYFDQQSENLYVWTNTRVTKILQNGESNGLSLFNTVEFTSSPYSPTNQVRAKKEVILSAGAFNSPQLLMLSGIGDKTELEKFPVIKPLINLPAVGKHATDHSMIANVVRVDTEETLEKYYAPKEFRNQFAKWVRDGTGPLGFTVANQIGFFRLPNNDPVLNTYGDPATGENTPHYELLFVPGHVSLTLPKQQDDWRHYNTIFTVITSPSSKGTVKLRTSDPFDPPVINPDYLATAVDSHIMVKAVRAVKKIVESKSWKGYFLGYAQNELANAESDDEILDYARTQ